MGVTGNVKSGWRKFSLQNSIAISYAKGGSYKRRKCNMQRRLEYPKVEESQDPEGRRRETLMLIKIVKKEVLQKLKL